MEFKDVEVKLKKKNKILFTRESACLQELLKEIRLQKHRTLVLWIFRICKDAESYVKNRDKEDTRVETARELCWKWAQGKCKMQSAKKALLAVHAIAKETNDPVLEAYCHALGQGYASVHVETHAIGFVMYELSAFVRMYGIDKKRLEDRIQYYHQELKRCEKDIENYKEWASFLLDDTRENKEMCLYVRKHK